MSTDRWMDKEVVVCIHNGILAIKRNTYNSVLMEWMNLEPIIHSEVSQKEKDKYRIQFSSVTQSCPTLCDPMDCSTPGFPVHHQLLELAQTHVHWVGDAIQLSHPLSSPSPPALIFLSIRVFSPWYSFLQFSSSMTRRWELSFSILPCSCIEQRRDPSIVTDLMGCQNL